MTIQIIYCPETGGRSARDRSNRCAKELSSRGYKVEVKALKTEMLHGLAFDYGVNISSVNNRGELCQFVIFDDTRFGKFLTNESDYSSYDDIAGFFKSKRDRKLELQVLAYQLGV